MRYFTSYYYYIILFVALFTACQHDDSLKEATQGTYSNKVTIAYQAGFTVSQTRATQPEEVENRIENIYLLLFNKEGKKVNAQYFDAATLDLSSPTQGKLDIEIPRKHEVRVYAIANVDSELMNLSVDKLDEIQNFEEFQHLSVGLTQKTIARGSSFIMTAQLTNLKGEVVTLSTKNIPNQDQLYKLSFKRIDAKISFNVTISQGVSFKPHSWQIMELPSSTELLDNAQREQSSTAQFFNSEPASFEDEGYSFSFYMLENKQVPRSKIKDQKDAYNLREKKDKTPLSTPSTKPGQIEQNGAFKYAPEHATYVVLKGQLAYKKEDNREVVADVTYTIHLGYSQKNINDYSVQRNTNYHYHIQIQSAESIILEVLDNLETRPGAKGHVTTSSRIQYADAHYSSQLLTFNFNEIGHLTWYVQTPFAEGYREDLFDKKHDGDSDWVLFKVNERERDYLGGAANYTNYLQPFPGENYRHPKNITGEQLLRDNRKLMTASQLVTYLHAAKLYEGTDAYGNNYTHMFYDLNNEIKVTAYINEYYYEEHPLTGAKSQTLWKQFVNHSDRIITFLNHSKFSSDGESSLANAIVSIRQQSIQTIYNKESKSLKTAWGTESIHETGPLPYNTFGVYNAGRNREREMPYNSTSNGRKNMIEIMQGSANWQWATFIDPYTNELNEGYRAAKYACMQRNRDNNGDQIIQPDEIRWYLAASDQLADLWIGANSLDQDARLSIASNSPNPWYVSSTVPSSYQAEYENIFRGYVYRDNPIVLWSSEGSSTGLLNEIPNHNPQQKYHYRCVRNLGLSNQQIDEEPQNIVEVKKNIISMEHLDKRSIRAYSQRRELPLHHESDADNRPWVQFEVDSQPSKLRGNNSWPELMREIDRGNSPCPPGYRAPNQRELAIMQSRLPKDKKAWKLDNHFSRTYYSKSANSSYIRGFSVNKSGERLYLTNSTRDVGGLRCVRDL